MKMKKICWTLSMSFLCLCSFVGCAQKLLSNPGSKLTNYAHAENGAVISLNRGRDSLYHPIATLINGVTDSNLWQQGEGWEYKYRHDVRWRGTAW